MVATRHHRGISMYVLLFIKVVLYYVNTIHDSVMKLYILYEWVFVQMVFYLAFCLPIDEYRSWKVSGLYSVVRKKHNFVSDFVLAV